MLVRTLALALGLAMAHVASAQTLPKPAEFYFDEDVRALKPLLAPGQDTPAELERILKKAERDPKAVLELAQLAHLAMLGGRADTGREMYARALARTNRSHPLWRTVVFNHAWDLYRAGDAAAALEQWLALHSGTRTEATWMPTTFALALWTLGRRDEAVQWYAAAVRTQPGDWSRSDGYARLLPDWREQDRATLAQVQAAWAAKPPAWP
jgi:tetratricopeptide (TPR) repeat protein